MNLRNLVNSHTMSLKFPLFQPRDLTLLPSFYEAPTSQLSPCILSSVYSGPRYLPTYLDMYPVSELLSIFVTCNTFPILKTGILQS